MVNTVNSCTKIPCGFFFVGGLSGKEKANLISLWIKKLHDIGVKIASLTSDGPPSNMAMFTELGVNLNPATLKTWFPRPLVKNEKV